MMNIKTLIVCIIVVTLITFINVLVHSLSMVTIKGGHVRPILYLIGHYLNSYNTD